MKKNMNVDRENRPGRAGRLICLVVAVVLTAGLLSGLTACKPRQKLYIFNCGDYIDPGIIEEFEKEYPQYKVVYDTYDTNETMYQKLVSTNTPYDILVPSDYMVSRLINEGRLKKIDMSKITNYDKIKPELKNKSYDPNNEYSVPYMWGTLGIIYNRELTGGDTIDSWDCLWDEKYKGSILMLDSIRDTMAISLIRLFGLDAINSTDPAQIEAAGKALEEQKTLVAQYGVDDIKDPMIRGNYALCLEWSGDAYEIIGDSDADLGYVVPKEGSNVWVDSMVIPAKSENTEGALLFIDFMCRTDIAVKNAEYIGYSTPHMEALNELGEEYIEDEVFNPSSETLARTMEFIDLGTDVMETYNKAWEKFRLTESVEEQSTNLAWLYIVIAVVVVGVIVFFVIRKKKRDKLRYSD